MTELELVKHTKKILEHSKNKEHSLWKKIREIILEIFIIVFAVSISIWFHNLNTAKENKHKEKDFFEGLAGDLNKDIVEWKKEKEFYVNEISILDYQICVGEGKDDCNSIKKTFSKDSRSIPQYTPVHNSYFEAAKSSEIFSIVTNKALLLETVNYYQEAIPFIKAQKDVFNEERTRLLNAYKENAVFSPNEAYDFNKMMKKPAVLFQAKMMKNSIYIVEHYNDIIKRTEELIAKIDKE